MDNLVLKIGRGVEDVLTLEIESELYDEGVAWELSEELIAELQKELKAHLGGEFSADFDPVIKQALDMFS